MKSEQSVLDDPAISGCYFYPQARRFNDSFVLGVNGVSLNCYQRIIDPDGFTLVHFHGNGETVSDYLPDLAEIFAGKGLNTLFVEYREYGGSTGNARLAAMLGDGEAVLDAAGLAPERTIAFGRSIGSLYAIELVSRLPNIAGLIIDSGIADLVPRFLDRADLASTGFDEAEVHAELKRLFSHEQKLSGYRQPLLVLHTENDGLLDISNAQKASQMGGRRSETTRSLRCWQSQLDHGVQHDRVFRSSGQVSGVGSRRTGRVMGESQQWYVTDEEQTWGPFSSSELLKLSQNGELLPTHYLSKDDKEHWQRASRINGLEFESESDACSATWGQLEWCDWIDLAAPLATYQSNISTGPGFYRLRSPELPGLVYVGQTGRNLRARTRCLASGVYADFESPPWNDPHTAAPLLWAYRHEDSFEFEVSVAEAHLDKQNLQCYEDYLLYLHRLQFGHSSLINHGRLHTLWTRPTNKRDGRATTRRDTVKEYPSLPPAVGHLDSVGKNWLGLSWSPFLASHELQAREMPGVYRVQQGTRLVYVGQSQNLKSRLRTHSKTARFIDCHFSFHEMPNAESHQLQEREADLIGAYFKTFGVPPIHQYKPAS